ncbi:MAG TPA: preprotein translocase subunit YajC [Clostridiales bacterium]|nr:preprotein translocase subunit YajC [Clostridiales bacterium]
MKSLLVLQAATETAAAGQQLQQGFPWQTLVTLALLFAIFYFLIIRPQKKREKQMSELRNSLEVGDEIVTIGGICGKIVNVKDDTITILSGESKLNFLKSSIASVTKADETEEE